MTAPTIHPRPGWGPPRRAFHPTGIDAIAVSPDGGTILTADHDGFLVWRASPGALPEAPYDAMEVRAPVRRADVRLVPDPSKEGSFSVLVVGAEGFEGRDLWVKLFGPVEKTKKGVKAIACSGDARTIAFASSTGNVELFTIHGRKVTEKRKLKVAGVKKVVAAALSRDGARLALAGDVVQVVRTDDGAALATFRGADAPLERVAFGGAESVIAIGGGRGWRWRIGEGEPQSFETPPYAATLAVAPDGRRVAVGSFEGLVVFDVDDLGPRWLTRARADAFAWRDRDTLLVAPGRQGDLRQLDAAVGARDRSDLPPEESRRDWLPLRDAVIAPDDGWIALVSADEDDAADDPYEVAREVRIFELATGQMTCRLRHVDEKVRKFVRPNAAAAPLALEWYDEQIELAPDLGSVAASSPRRHPAALASADGRRIVTREASGVAVRDRSTGEAIAALPAKLSSGGLVGTYGIAISRDGEQVAIWGDALTVHRLGQQKPVYRCDLRDASVLVDPGFTRAVLLREAGSEGVDLGTGRTRSWLLRTAWRGGPACISPDGRWIAVDEGDVGFIVLRRALDGELAALLRGWWGSPRRLLFTASGGAVIAAAYDGFLMRWDLPPLFDQTSAR